MSFRLNTLAPANAGIESKKDILLESTLLNFKILAAVMVIPALLTPGIRDKIWKIPINMHHLDGALSSDVLSSCDTNPGALESARGGRPPPPLRGAGGSWGWRWLPQQKQPYCCEMQSQNLTKKLTLTKTYYPYHPALRREGARVISYAKIVVQY